MEGKKFNTSTILLIITLFVIIAMGICLYKFYNEKVTADENSAKLQTEVNSLNETVKNLQGKLNTIANTINLGNTTQTDSSTTKTSNFNPEDVEYSFDTETEGKITIKATVNEDTISEEFDCEEKPYTGITNIPGIGKVAFFTESAGEYYGINFYQLVDNSVILLGSFSLFDSAQDTTYTVKIKDENTAVITAKVKGETFTEDINSDTKIDDTKVVNFSKDNKDVLNSDIVLIISSDENYKKVQAYTLCVDYVTGEITEFKEIGIIKTSSN